VQCRTHLQNDIDNVERVNRRAARFVSGDRRHQSSVSVMLEKLQWPTVEHRRKNYQRLTTMFKIVRGLVAVPTSSLIPADPCTRCNHQYKFKCISASTTVYKIFYPRTIPSVTTLTKKPPRRLSSTASRVVCTSSPSPFVDVLSHVGSLSTTLQIQTQNQ